MKTLDQSLVTVVINCYNGEKYLQNALESIKNHDQQYLTN